MHEYIYRRKNTSERKYLLFFRNLGRCKLRHTGYGQNHDPLASLEHMSAYRIFESSSKRYSQSKERIIAA